LGAKSFRFSLGDWLWNAAITGFINIVEHSGEKIQIKDDGVEFSTNVLEDFSEKYFAYFTDTYQKTLSWYKLVSYKKVIESYKDSNFANLDLDGLKKVNVFIKDVAKKLLTSSSYKAAFELIGLQERMTDLEKKLHKVNEPKTEEEFIKQKDNIKNEIEHQFSLIEDIIEYCNSAEGKKYITAKNIIYTIIRNGWDSVSFLNPQTKEKDMFKDFENYFVKDAVDYLESDKQKYRYQCFNCGMPIKDLKNDLSFINEVGFDVARKPSHVWNYNNDIAICPLCKLVYSCLPAGFIYVNDSGLFINANIDMNYMLSVNRNVKQSVLQEIGGVLTTQKLYQALVESLRKQELEKSKFELSDIQVVRFRKGTYRFNILPHAIIKLINNHHQEISTLFRTGYKEGGDRYSIYEQVLDRVINNQNLFSFLYRLLHLKLSSPMNCFFSTDHIFDILSINFEMIKNIGGMQGMDNNRDILKEARGAGYYLRQEYIKGDRNINKIPGISYRLLNALKTNNRNMFMDTLLNCYLYVRKEVPNVFLSMFEDDDQFRTIGYAFMTGFIDEKKEVINN